MKRILTFVMALVVMVTVAAGFGKVNAYAAVTPFKVSVNGYVDREVVSMNCEFYHEKDANGQMIGNAKGGKITIKVKALNDGNPDLMDWMVEERLSKNGVITITDTKSGKVERKIEFENAYCVGYEETFEVKKDGSVEHYEEIVITCGVIRVGNFEYKNSWN